MLYPHHRCMGDGNVEIADSTNNRRLLDESEVIGNDEYTFQGTCIHKDVYPPMAYEAVGYALLFLIIFMLYLSDLIHEGYIILVMFLMFEFDHKESVGYMN